MREFEELMRYAWENGAAVERFIENNQLCTQIIQKAQSLEDISYHNGGNAALMGMKFLSQGADVLLGGAVGEHTKPLLPPNIRIANQEGHDEIHLILEFSRGERWGELTAPRDNRLIVHCDYTNSRLNVLEEFHSALASFQPELVVITGVHLLEREDPSFRTKRLQTIVSEIKKVNKEAPVHFELASNSDIGFISEVGSTILPHVDSLGLNEQELGYLYASLGGTKVAKSSVPKYVKKHFKEPKVQTISNAIAFIFNKIKPATREFSRIHFHYLKYHIVAQRKGSRWVPGKKSVVIGSMIASIQSCVFSDIQKLDELFFVPFSSETSTLEAVRFWEEQGIEFYLSPVLVCKSPKKTVGLGDAISATGLLYHQQQTSQTKKVQ
uniref:ADP-dependent glucokinase n=1 Tax=Arcella intermedia TaxID=1963864 RepID=A0A6B2L6Q5_9EUKA